ncbi:MAG: ATP-binding cassette domain-containing protein, partial [Alphaproteobacteria bacterium]|nr:ATP-binding cassette domain-containing protein [Alphaproteobacteria bacterium]
MIDPGIEPAIRLSGVNKHFGTYHALRDIDLEVAEGEKVVVCGPSGSGKSTMIRCINRLDEHDSGQIFVQGVELTDNLNSLDEVRRDVGMVFQKFNLFPHLTVRENCALPQIRVRGTGRRESEEMA